MKKRAKIGPLSFRVEARTGHWTSAHGGKADVQRRRSEGRLRPIRDMSRSFDHLVPKPTLWGTNILRGAGRKH